MNGRSSRAALLALVLGCGLTAAAHGDGPLAIHAPALTVPDEAAGSGVAPEASVRIAIDARGAVTAVEVVSITPSTEYDPFFRRRLVDTLSSWRFAPAEKDGKAQASTLEWKVRFPAKPQQLQLETGATAALAGGDAGQRRATVLAMPEEQRRRLLELQAKAALAALDARSAREVQTPRFVVHTDADAAVARAIANDLEAIFDVLAHELLPGVAVQPERYKIHVFAYRARAEYQALISSMPVYEWSAGYYSPAGMIAFHLDQQTSEQATATLLHEATHAFLDRHVTRPGVALPRWLDEGFADYVGNSQIQGGRLVAGKTLKRAYTFVNGSVVDLRTAAGASVEETKRAWKQGKGLGVGALLAAAPDIFYGDGRHLYYASAWLFVHYLRDGQPGWAGERFPHLLLYVAEGYPPLAAFRGVYGSPEAAEAAFQQYVKAF